MIENKKEKIFNKSVNITEKDCHEPSIYPESYEIEKKSFVYPTEEKLLLNNEKSFSSKESTVVEELPTDQELFTNQESSDVQESIPLEESSDVQELTMEPLTNQKLCNHQKIQIDCNNNSLIFNVNRFKNINFSICKKHRNDVLFENDMFMIKFDIPTPRPHLIILFKYQTFKQRNVSDLSNDQLSSLMNVCYQFINELEAQAEEFTLSFHTGLWASSKHFHAHLIIDIDLYIRLLLEKNLDMRYISPSKNWNMSLPSTDLFDLYIQNVLDYSASNVANVSCYRKKEIERIRSLDHVSSKYQLPFHNKRSIDLKFDMKTPRLGFSLKDQYEWSSERQRIEIIKTMIDYSNKNGYNDKHGSHICIEISKSSEGFMRISGDKFYELHPLRDLFLKNFEDMNEVYYVDT